MDDMARYPGLLLRNGIYYHQVRVPADIAASYGKLFERRSLRTRDLKEAAAKLASEDQHVQRLFEEHRRKLIAGADENSLGSGAGAEPAYVQALDLHRIARRHAHDVADQEYADRAANFVKLERRVAMDGSAEALFRGEIMPLPVSPYLDHLLSDGEIETDTALAVIFKIRLKARIEELRRALMVGNFAAVASVVQATAGKADESEQRLLARALMRAEIGALQTIVDDAAGVDVSGAALEGDPNGRNSPPEHVSNSEAETSHGAAAQGPLLSTVECAWMAEKDRTNAWVEKTRHEREAAVRAFKEVCGDRPIGSYRKTDAREFKDILFSVPPNAHKMQAYRGKTLRQIAEVAKASRAKHPSAKNVGLKMDAVASLFLWARRNFDEVTSNPFEGVKPKVGTTARDERDPFTPAELQKIFAMPPFTGALSVRKWLTPGQIVLRSTGRFWVPWIALYSGARLTEIVQLRKSDVRMENGVTFFDLNDDGDKRVKTKTEKRRIPAHPALWSAPTGWSKANLSS
ncbi:DUF6538 domain-containing protein [Aurantimonas coralicida]|uniref:DUF6538 domain-containing protein n=1 Tax=Aurantimonas coralicida TaxID=182270 RepID=UPI001D17DCE3|nr:DUF6538 domain-containing protein [Aurantimonas coralicida]MCC4300202.1 hypothetical protein [Aurantimonas coralicida]